MADAACGPSTALQSFHKHTNVDRTLQQDRLTSRRGPAENFRSDQTRNAGVLDPEFEAFQAGQPLLLEQDALPFNPHFAGPSTSHAPFAPQPALPAWAADFQRLNISQTPAHQAPQMRSGVGPSWHQEFLRQQQQSPMMNQTQSFQTPQYSSMGYQRPMQFMPSAVQQPQIGQEQWKGKEKWTAESATDQAAFDKEFELFATETLQRDATVAETTATHENIQVEGSRLKTSPRAAKRHVEIVEPVPDLEEDLQEDDLQEQPVEEEVFSTPPENIPEGPIEGDELAEPAGRLLGHVGGNYTEKFQKSEFLDLMRRLRDRKTVIKGDDFVDRQEVSKPKPA